MKKIIAFLAFTTLSTVVYPQLPLVEYKPVIVGGNNNKSNSNKEYNFENNNSYFPNIPSYSTPNRFHYTELSNSRSILF